MTTEPTDITQARENALNSAIYLLNAPECEDKDCKIQEYIETILAGFPQIPGIRYKDTYYPQEEIKKLFKTLEQIAEGDEIPKDQKEMIAKFNTSVPFKGWEPVHLFPTVRALFLDDNILYEGNYYPTVELEEKSKTLEQLLEENN